MLLPLVVSVMFMSAPLRNQNMNENQFNVNRESKKPMTDELYLKTFQFLIII